MDILLVVTSNSCFFKFWFKPLETKNQDWFKVNDDDELHFLFPSENPIEYKSLNIPFTGKFLLVSKKQSLSKNLKVNTKDKYVGLYGKIPIW